jgi:two-component system, OmpR family, response regulator
VPAESKLLGYLIWRRGRTLTRATLLEDLWHYRIMPRTNLVDVRIGNLRRKLDLPGDPPLIRSVRGSSMPHASE